MELLHGNNPQEVIRQWLGTSTFRHPLPALAGTTMHVVKERLETSLGVSVVFIQDVMGQRWHYTFLLARKEGVWCVQTTSGGREEGLTEPAALQQCPWVRLEALVLGNEFSAFGEVLDKGYPIVHVRLFDPKGLMLEDTVQNGIVLFTSTQQPMLPLQLELYDETNRLVSRQTTTLDAFPSVTKEVE